MTGNLRLISSLFTTTPSTTVKMCQIVGINGIELRPGTKSKKSAKAGNTDSQYLPINLPLFDESHIRLAKAARWIRVKIKTIPWLANIANNEFDPK